jgi:hypothetical protein
VLVLLLLPLLLLLLPLVLVLVHRTRRLVSTSRAAGGLSTCCHRHHTAADAANAGPLRCYCLKPGLWMSAPTLTLTQIQSGCRYLPGWFAEARHGMEGLTGSRSLVKMKRCAIRLGVRLDQLQRERTA